MARTGRFGRQPRAATSLTNTVIAIAREEQNQIDQNIMSAWQKGGTFDGKRATDDLVLKHWRDRMDGISKDDPLYDTYHQTVQQLDYSIHESKMTAAYALHKKTDAEMVHFYLGWAKKAPRNSEFYRVLQRDAGQYMRNVTTSNTAAAAAAKEAAYQKAQGNTRQGMEAAGEYIIDTLRRVAQSGYAATGIAPLIGDVGSGSDFTDFDPSDPEQMLRLLQVIAPERMDTSSAETTGLRTTENDTVHSGKFGGTKDVIFHDDDKKPVTGADIMRHLSKLDPSFKPGQPLDIAAVSGWINRQKRGLNERITRANKTGHVTDASELGKSKSYISMIGRQVDAMPIQAAYNEARESFDQIANDPSTSPAAFRKARQEYDQTLMSLAGDKRIVADDNLKSRLVAEAQHATGFPTLHDSFTGLSTGDYDPAKNDDSTFQANRVEFMDNQDQMVREGKAVWTFGKTDPQTNAFTPDPNGTEIGAADPADVAANGAPGTMDTITIPDPKGSGSITLSVTALPVYATAKDPVTGQPIKTTNSAPIAWAYSVPQGGQLVTSYAFDTADKGRVKSADPNWDTSIPMLPVSSGGAHFEVDLSQYIPQAPGDQPGTTKPAIDLSVNTPPGGSAPGAPGFVVVGAKPPTAQNPAGTPGTLVMDSYVAAASSDNRGGVGVADPTTDSHSLTLATLMQTQEGQVIVRDVDNQPAFKAQFDRDAYTYGGYKQDPETGAWMDPDGSAAANGGEAKFYEAQGQTAMATSAKTVEDFLTKSFAAVREQIKNKPLLGGTPNKVPGTEGYVAPLPSTQVEGTTFDAAGKAFVPGTSQLAQNMANAFMPQGLGMAIQPVGAIKVPAYVPPTPVAQNVQSTVPGQTSSQTQQSSSAPASSTQQSSSAPPPPHGGSGSPGKKYL